MERTLARSKEVTVKLLESDVVWSYVVQNLIKWVLSPKISEKSPAILPHSAVFLVYRFLFFSSHWRTRYITRLQRLIRLRIA